MDFLLLVISGILICSAEFFVKCENQTDLIKQITVDLSIFFRVNCIILLHSSEGKSRSFKIFKALSSELTSYVGIHTFQENDFIRKVKGRTCSRPMHVITSDELKDEFAKSTYKNSMTDEIWLLFLSTPLHKFFERARPPFNSEVFVAEILSTEEAQLKEVYAVDASCRLRVADFGKWSLSNRLNVPSIYIYERRVNLEGKLMKVGSTENWPMCTFRDGKWDGYMPRVWLEIQNVLNCTTIPVRSLDNAAGLQFKNGSWNGLMKMIINKEIDVIAAELTVTTSRIKHLKFCHPLLTSSYQVYFSALGYNLEWMAIFKPLNLEIWLILCCWIIIATLCMSLSYFFCERIVFDQNSKLNFSGVESFYFILQSLCQQGYPIIPKSISCRIIFLMAYFLSAVMIPSYSASLISSLTCQTFEKPFDSLEEFAARGTYKMLIRRNSVAFNFFSESKNPLYKEIFEKSIKNLSNDIQIDNIPVALDTLCDNKHYAFFGINKIIELRMQNHQTKCKIVSFSKPLNPIFLSLAVQKESPFFKLINHHLQKMISFGIINRIKGNIRPLDREIYQMKFKEVELHEIFQIFFILLSGIILSVFFLIIECHLLKISLRNHKKTVESLKVTKNVRRYMIRLDSTPFRSDLYME